MVVCELEGVVLDWDPSDVEAMSVLEDAEEGVVARLEIEGELKELVGEEEPKVELLKT